LQSARSDDGWDDFWNGEPAFIRIVSVAARRPAILFLLRVGCSEFVRETLPPVAVTGKAGKPIDLPAEPSQAGRVGWARRSGVGMGFCAETALISKNSPAQSRAIPKKTRRVCRALFRVTD